MPDLFSIVMETIFSVWDWIPEHLIFVNLLLSVGIVVFPAQGSADGLGLASGSQLYPGIWNHFLSTVLPGL